MVDVNFEKLKINFSSLPILFKGQEGLLFVISKRENRHYVREGGWGVSERDWSIRGIDWGRERERERKSLGHSKREIGAFKREKDIEVFEKEIGAFKRGTIEREGEREREKEGDRERSSDPVIGSTAIALGLDIFPAISVVRLLPSTLATSI